MRGGLHFSCNEHKVSQPMDGFIYIVSILHLIRLNRFMNHKKLRGCCQAELAIAVFQKCLSYFWCMMSFFIGTTLIFCTRCLAGFHWQDLHIASSVVMTTLMQLICHHKGKDTLLFASCDLLFGNMMHTTVDQFHQFVGDWSTRLDFHIVNRGATISHSTGTASRETIPSVHAVFDRNVRQRT